MSQNQIYYIHKVSVKLGYTYSQTNCHEIIRKRSVSSEPYLIASHQCELVGIINQIYFASYIIITILHVCLLALTTNLDIYCICVICNIVAVRNSSNELLLCTHCTQYHCKQYNSIVSQGYKIGTFPGYCSSLKYFQIKLSYLHKVHEARY